MKKKIRNFLFSILAIIFFVISPAIILYSQGYRLDFQNWQILKTGGVYVKTSLPGADVYVDNKFVSKTGQIFSFDYLVQNLFPKKHNIKVGKTGYITWEKNLLVKEKMVTQTYVILFPEKIDYTSLGNNFNKIYPFSDQNKLIAIDSKNQIFAFEAEQKTLVLGEEAKNLSQISDIIISGDGSRIILKAIEKKTGKTKYYLLPLDKETTALTALKTLDKTVGQISFYSNNVIYFELGSKLYKEALDAQKITAISPSPITAFTLQGDSLYFLQNNSLFKKNVITGITETLSKQTLPLKSKSSYSLLVYWGKVFVLENQKNLYIFDETQGLKTLIISESPLRSNGFFDKMMFYNDSRAWLYFLKDYESPFFVKADTLMVLMDYQKINGLDWVGGEYFARLNENSQAVISEIDNRDKINSFMASSDSATQIWFDQKNKKLYLLSNDKLLVSPKLIP